MLKKNGIDKIVDFIRSGEKDNRFHKIGVEIEHFLVNEYDYTLIDYYGDFGIQNILYELSKMGYNKIYENEHLIGLENEYLSISLEPGGQFEVSIKPFYDLKKIEEIYLNFEKEMNSIISSKHIKMINIGYLPNNSINEIKFLPKKRYEMMSNYFLTKGKYAHNMMKGTASIQVIIDYEDENDFIKKFRVANFLSPLFYLITDNSPIFEKSYYNSNSLRSTIWQNTDNERCGIVENSLNKIFDYSDYANYILNVCPIFYLINNDYKISYNKKVIELIDELDKKEEIYHLMTMVFPEVRVKNYIEIRTSDTLPYPYNLGYFSFIKGIFYNENLLNKIYDISLDFKDKDLNFTMNDIQKNGFEACFYNFNMNSFMNFLFEESYLILNEEEKKSLKKFAELSLNKKNLSIMYKEKRLCGCSKNTDKI
jgi:glutamate--cysteine ligase